MFTTKKGWILAHDGGSGAVNFVSHDGDILFHFNVRREEGHIVMNSCRGGAWDREERVGIPAVASAEVYTIMTDAEGFKVSFRGVLLHAFAHRLDFARLARVEIAETSYGHAGRASVGWSISTFSPTVVGSAVQCLFTGNGLHYPATITAANADGTFLVTWKQDGSTQDSCTGDMFEDPATYAASATPSKIMQALYSVDSEKLAVAVLNHIAEVCDDVSCAEAKQAELGQTEGFFRALAKLEAKYKGSAAFDARMPLVVGILTGSCPENMAKIEAAREQVAAEAQRPPKAWILSHDGGSGAVNFVSHNGDVLFHFNVRREEGQIVMNSCRGGDWDREEREERVGIPAAASAASATTAVYVIKADAEGFKVIVKGTLVHSYNHRLDFDRFEKVVVLDIGWSVRAPAEYAAAVASGEVAAELAAAVARHEEEEESINSYFRDFGRDYP